MSFERVEAFLSCSLQPDDKEVFSLFFDLCAALNISCSNIDAGSLGSPSAMVRKKLEDQAFLIAICTRKEEKKTGKFVMPDAVHEEIGIACGMGRPIQLFVEDGVEFAGFAHQFGAHVPFNRDDLFSRSTLKRIVKTLFTIRTEALEKVNRTHPSPDATKAEFVRVRTEQTEHQGKKTWAYKIHRKLLFADASEPYADTDAWVDDYQIVPGNAPPFEFGLEVFERRGVDEIVPTIKRRDGRGVSATLQFLPAPREGDWIEYETAAYSPYMMPMWSSDTDEKVVTKLKKRSFRAVSGFVCSTDTKHLTVEQRFPRTLKLLENDMHKFAATFMKGVGLEVPTETDRIDHSCKFVGNGLVSILENERPLPGCFYGIAWDPKPRDAAQNRTPRSRQGNGRATVKKPR